MSEQIKSGVYSYQLIKDAIKKREIFSKCAEIADEQIQPASIDLRLGNRAYRLISSFLPENRAVDENLHIRDMYGDDLVMYDFDLSEGRVLEKGGVYLIPLMEELDLPESVRARVNPKSTTGRLDIFARVITDRSPRFDDIARGYKGKLFLELMPRSFPIKVKEGLSLVQLRLMKGDCRVTDTKLRTLNNDYRLLYKGEKPMATKDMKIHKGFFMRVDLSGENSGGIIGYKSKKNSHFVDLTKRDHYNINDFWEPIKRPDKGTLILEPEEFYILSSTERIRVPPMCAAEMVAFEAGSGELRTHYAGFFDPGFGYGPDGDILGTKAVLEVRAHDVPFMIANGQTFCKLFFEKMIEVPEKVYGPKIGSSYQFQGITLSKQFKSPPREETMEK